jgi:hypothetical protein
MVNVVGRTSVSKEWIPKSSLGSLLMRRLKNIALLYLCFSKSNKEMQ